MSIAEYIEDVRFFLLRQALSRFALWISIFASLLFVTIVQLESIFYLLPREKVSFFLSIITIFIFSGGFSALYYSQAKNNKVTKYKIENIASSLGDKIFPEKRDLVLNALQLETKTEKNESEVLAISYIQNIQKKLVYVNLHESFFNASLPQLKYGLLSVWIGILIIFFFKYDSSADAFFRLTNPNEIFPAPKPFTLLSMSGDIHIIGGEEADIYVQAYPLVPDTLHLDLIPSQASNQKRDSLSLHFKTTAIEDGVFHFKLPELFQDYSYQAFVKAKHFWEAWETVSSDTDTIFVTDRPAFDNFTLTTIPPPYSKLERRTQKGNIAMVEGLKGSIVQIDLSSNRMLQTSYIDKNGERSEMSSSYNKASGYFTLVDEGEFTVNLVDKRGITNRDPVPYKINIIPDHNPNISVIAPPKMTELGNDQTIPIHLEINDDFGFTNLQLAYEIQRPAYLQADPYVAMFNINGLHTDSLNQKIEMYWDLTDMMLMPDDEVHFHFELTDNDNISGPKKTISNTFIAQVPSLADLYESIDNSEENLIDEIVNGLDELDDIKNQFEATELQMLKSKELDWDEQQSLKNSLEQSKKEIENIEKIAEAITSLTEQVEKHKLFSPGLLEKFKELSELVSEIIPEEMMNNMEDLEMALESMDMEALQDALDELSNNMAQIEEDLDRYLEIFKRFQAEQKLDEIQNRMQNLYEQQNALDDEIRETQDDQSNMNRLAQEEQRNLDEFENILSLIEDASELIDPFNENSSQELSSLSDSDLSEEIESNFDSVIQNLSSQNSQEAMGQSQEAMANLEMMMQQMMNIQQGFNQQSVSEMMEKFQDLLQSMLYLSSQEEQLKNDVDQASRNSPRLREFARRQQVLQDQLQSMTEKMLQLSNETFAITPDIGRGVGKANAGMENAKSKLADRNLTQAGNNQDLAMEGLNEAALGLFNSMQNMQESGSASGFQQFLQMMQQMSGNQQTLNQKGMQFNLGQMAAAAQQQMMQQMLDDQKGIRKSLEQLIKEMRNSGGGAKGDLSGISKEMDEVIKDLKNKRYSRKTQERQQRILSRMLDSQTSMTQRGEKDERKSSSAMANVLFQGPGGMPADLGQRENMALQALKNAMKAGYSKDHQIMIKRYFNSLSQLSSKDTIINNEEN